jgi:hypothetical protein
MVYPKENGQCVDGVHIAVERRLSSFCNSRASTWRLLRRRKQTSSGRHRYRLQVFFKKVQQKSEDKGSGVRDTNDSLGWNSAKILRSRAIANPSVGRLRLTLKRHHDGIEHDALKAPRLRGSTGGTGWSTERTQIGN